MTSVREATFELFRAHGMTTIFGNPGSTELPMLRRLPRGLHLRARPAGAGGGRHGRRVRAGQRPPHARQPAHRAGRRQRGRRDLQRPGQQVAAGDHRRPAGPPADHDRGQPHQPRRHRRPAAVREVEPRAAAGPGRARRDRARDPSRHAAAARARRSCRSRWTTGTPRPTQDRSARRDRAARGRPHAARRGRSQRSGRAPGRRRSPRCWSPAPTSTPPAAGTPPSRWPRSSACRSGPAPPPAAPGSASPRATRTSSACCRPRSARSPRRSRATTSCSSSAPRCSRTTPTFPARCWARPRSWWRSPAIPARPPGRRWATRSSATSGSRSSGWWRSCPRPPATRPTRAPIWAIRRPPTRPIA